MTPASLSGISKTLQSLGRYYVRYFNDKYHRSGTLWEGRYKSTLLDSNNYLLTCYRYIELNPVRAGMVERPEEYKWSSYGVNAWGDSSWLIPHEEYMRLGQTTEERCNAYRELFRYQLSEADLHRFRKAAHYCQPVGDDRFCEQIEKQYGIRLGKTIRGRPKKQVAEVVNE